MPDLDQDNLEQNKTTIRRLYDECLNQKDLDVAHELIAENFTSPEADGVEGFRKLARALHAAFDPVTYTIEDIVAEGDKMAIRWRMKGVHSGAFAGVQPTGKAVEQYANVMYHFDDGKVSAAWPQVDSLGLLQQLGAIPSGAFHPHTASSDKTE